MTPAIYVSRASERGPPYNSSPPSLVAGHTYLASVVSLLFTLIRHLEVKGLECEVSAKLHKALQGLIGKGTHALFRGNQTKAWQVTKKRKEINKQDFVTMQLQSWSHKNDKGKV